MIEKGPFVQGSKVALYELKNDLSQTGRSFKTQTNSDLGAFRFESVSLESQYVELETSGYFYNEVKGGLSSSEITLNALSDVSNRNAVNVNLLTHLEFGRVKKLVQSGSSFSSAKKQVERELLKCFAITDEISSPEGISITDNNKGSSILLAISTIMLYDKSEGEFTEFLAKFMADFADNGVIDNQTLREGIAAGQQNAHPSEVIEQMKGFYANKGVQFECGVFSKYIDFNGDGVIDENDKEEDNSNSIAEDVLYSEGLVRQDLSGAYAALEQFVGLQLKIEHVRMVKGASSINPSSANDNTLNEAWTCAYKAINMANLVIRSMERIGWDTILPYYYADAHAIRAFVYEQLAVLWGNVPVVTGEEGVTDMVPQRTQNEVVEFALKDAQKAQELFNSSVNPWGYASTNSVKTISVSCLQSCN